MLLEAGPLLGIWGARVRPSCWPMLVPLCPSRKGQNFQPTSGYSHTCAGCFLGLVGICERSWIITQGAAWIKTISGTIWGWFWGWFLQFCLATVHSERHSERKYKILQKVHTRLTYQMLQKPMLMVKFCKLQRDKLQEWPGFVETQEMTLAEVSVPGQL